MTFEQWWHKNGSRFCNFADYNRDTCRELWDAAVEAEREKANRVILSCYRAFRPSSDYVKREAKRLADEWVQEMEIRARGDIEGRLLAALDGERA